ncbi:hypothetical protein N9W00_01360 [Arcobacteraceae bacterium]|nr:hypothetical protein [Arcobacteraceae bacterium]
MNIEKVDNKVFFNFKSISFANITIEQEHINIELIKVIPEHRGKNYASQILVTILEYIKMNFSYTKKIQLSQNDTLNPYNMIFSPNNFSI